MRRTEPSFPKRWAHVLFSAALLGVLTPASEAGDLLPRPGLHEFMAPALVAVPGGHVSAAGGNFFHARSALALDTRLGPLAVGAVYNSTSGWSWNVDASYAGGSLRDTTGAFVSLGALASGEAAPGTHWVKLDATRVKTKGGLVHEFDPTTGRLLAVRWASAAYPRLRFVQAQIAGQWRASAVEQCPSASACEPVFAFGYDGSARLVRIDDRAGRTALVAYDADGRLSALRDGLDVANGWPGTRYTYAAGFLAGITSSEGERIEVASDAAGRTRELRGVGAGNPAWRFGYGSLDAAGLYTVTAVDPLGAVSEYRVDTAGRVHSLANALGELTTWTWSGLRPAARTRPDGTTTRWTWVNDDLASETLPSGNVRTFSYRADATSREQPLARPLLELRDTLGLVERRTYDASGRLTSVANGASETTTRTYDASEALASVTAPDGTQVLFSGYGAHGHPSFARFAGSSGSEVHTYDAIGNRIRGTTPDPLSGGVKQRGFDADRYLSVLEVVDAPASGAAGVERISLEHRSDGQLARVQRPGGGTTTFRFDALGHLVAIAETVSPGGASVTTLARDLLGRVTAVERANGMREELEYDAAGHISRRRSLRGGAVESDVWLEYAAGRLVRARDGAGFEETLAYDAAGRLREVRHTDGETTRFSYDARSRLVETELTLPGGVPVAVLSHGHDAADREVSLRMLGIPLVTRAFVAGRVEQTRYGNGVREDHFRSTQDGRAAGRELWRGTKRIEKSDYTLEDAPGGAILQLRSKVTSGTSADATTQEDYAYATLYGQNAMERRVSSSRANPTGGPAESLQYDALSSFVGGSASGMARAVGLNAERNRALSALHPDPSGLVGVGLTSSFAYDAAGFVTTETIGIGGFPASTNGFSWNARGQLAAIHADGALLASFAYDPLGRRRERTIGGVRKRWRFGGLVEASSADQPVAIDLGEVRVDLAGSHLFRHRDLRGNPKLVTNGKGLVVRHNAYTAYGQSGTFGAQADDVGFAWGTPIATALTGYVLIGARLYSPMLARFLAPDPIWNPVNPYAYTLGNPVDFWDPAGGHAGSHHDLYQADLGFGRALFAYTAAVLGVALAPAGVALPVAVAALGGAVFWVADALVEMDQQYQRHKEESRAEAGGTPESHGGGGLGGGAGRGEAGGGGRGTWEVCSHDGMAEVCTRGPRSSLSSGWTGVQHILLY
jgi:RHS repeat-associated protein